MCFAQDPASPPVASRVPAAIDIPNSNLEEMDRMSPVSRERAGFSPMRRTLLEEQFDASGNRKEMTRQQVAAIADEYMPKFPMIRFEGERVFVNQSLFDPMQRFITCLNRTYVWSTNLERMQMGKAPICYRAHLDDDLKKDPQEYTLSELRLLIENQNEWVLDLHHITQESTGYGLVTLTPGLHLGWDARYLVEFGGDQLKVLKSRIAKDEVGGYKQFESSFTKIISNVLHPMNEITSQVDRQAFRSFRSRWWKSYAESLIRGEDEESLSESESSEYGESSTSTDEAEVPMRHPVLGKKRKREGD